MQKLFQWEPITSTLTVDEYTLFTKWLENLSSNDKDNIERVIKNCYSWMEYESEKLELGIEALLSKESGLGISDLKDFNLRSFKHGHYFVLSAIGSSVSGSDYGDIDLLLFTNRPEGKHNTFYGDLVERGFNQFFNDKPFDITNTEYDMDPSLPIRKVVDLIPPQKDARPIQLTAQFGVNNEQQFIGLEEFRYPKSRGFTQRVPIFRYNVNGPRIDGTDLIF